MPDESDIAEAVANGATTLPLRAADGAINPAYVAVVEQAVEAGDADILRTLVEDLHESDAGDLIEALDSEARPKLIELMGAHFDFTALTEVDDAIREEILEELEPGTVAEGV